MGGAVCGFTKAYNVEQGMRDGLPLVKVVDFEVSRKTAEPADLLIAETLARPALEQVAKEDPVEELRLQAQRALARRQRQGEQAHEQGPGGRGAEASRPPSRGLPAIHYEQFMVSGVVADRGDRTHPTQL